MIEELGVLLYDLLLILVIYEEPASCTALACPEQVWIIEHAILVYAQVLAQLYERPWCLDQLELVGLWYLGQYVCQKVVEVAHDCANQVVLSVEAEDDYEEHEEPREELCAEGEDLKDVHLHIGVPSSPDVKHCG